MTFFVSIFVGEWTNWLTFESDPDHSPDTGTRLLSPIAYMHCNAGFYYVGKIPCTGIGRPSTQRRVVLRRRNTVVGGKCALLTQPCWWYRPLDVQHSVTVPSQWLRHVRGTAAVVCQECTVADDVPSRAEDRTFPVVVWQWLGDRDCTAQYNCCLPSTTDCQRFCCFVFLFFSFFLSF